MASMMDLPSLRKQQLLSEFTGLKHACPEGVFVSLTPGDSTLWSAVLFVRDGPYAPAVLRFEISFPDSYPKRPPLILFSTDMFHPLITPLTTHMYSTDVQDNGPKNATEEEILPPGGFSLRHGFPDWFKRNKSENKRASGDHTVETGSIRANEATSAGTLSPEPTTTQTPGSREARSRPASIYSMLKYIRSTFNNAEILDSVPLTASGNPGAWHAWRTHRRGQGHLMEIPQDADSSDQAAGDGVAVNDATSLPSPSSVSRRPGEWNWDGVWEARVKKGIAASLSEPALYGGSGVPDEMIRFVMMEDNEVDSVKQNLRHTLGST